MVLTHRFWSNALASDPNVIGKVIRLGERSATIVGVVEPSVPYPSQTEIIANIVTSPHHLDATMVHGRVHRMTELFGRLAPGTDLEAARNELRAVHKDILKAHPEAYPRNADFQIEARRLRDEITSPARTVLLILLAASALVFVIACSNVANLILARSVRREGELAIRASLGATTGALRRTLLVESLLLCGVGAALGVLVARPMVAVLAQYASRFSVRALEVTVDSSLLWVGVSLALIAAVLLAFVPRLPTADTSNGSASLASGTVRITSGTNRRLRAFAVTQIAASFVLLAGAGMLLTTLMALQAAETGLNTRNVLALHVPVEFERPRAEVSAFYKEVMRRITELPGVERVAVGTIVPWREAGTFGPGFQFSAEGYAKAGGEEDPRARFRTVSPGFFPALGVPIIAGRDFSDADRLDGESVVIVSQSLAQRMFSTSDALNRRLMWSDPVMQFIGVHTKPRRIIGVAADLDDENIVPGPAMTVYHPLGQEFGGGRDVRPHQDGSVRAGAANHANHPRPVAGPAGGAGRDARGRARGSAGAGSPERAGVRRVCRGRAADCRGRRRRRAGVLGERADARVRHPPGDRLRAEAPDDPRAQRRRGDCRRGHRRRRRRRVRAGAVRRQLHHGCAAAWDDAADWRAASCWWARLCLRR